VTDHQRSVRRRRPVCVALLLIAAGYAAIAAAAEQRNGPDYRALVGYTKLQAELGERLPTGEGVRVTQVEVAIRKDREPTGWGPATDDPLYEGKVFVLPGLPSEHGSDVARRFYSTESMARGVTEVECYPNTLWAFASTGFLRTGTGLLPLASPSRVANHSWVGSVDAGPEDSEDDAPGPHPWRDRRLEILKRVDYLVAIDDFIQVAGADNKRAIPDLLQCAYNPIIVGRTAGRHSMGTKDVGEGLYGAGRAKPDIVGPAPYTSTATPLVAAAAALLVGFGHDRGTELSRGSYLLPRIGRTVYHAETSEVVKAALMAGADRKTGNGSRALRDVVGYRSRRQYCTDNGLDVRYGAGQLNVYNSYHILAAGERDSAEDSLDGGDAKGGQIGLEGYDYDPSFGGANGSNRQATYSFTCHDDACALTAALVWNVRVNGGGRRWDGDATLYDLDLKLYDLTRTSKRPIVKSISAIDNTENVWRRLEPGHRYELRVVVPQKQSDFEWDYGLAWQVMASESAPGPEFRPLRP